MSRNRNRLIQAIAVAALMVATPAYGYINHKVERGQTLWGIAHTYGISADDIIKLNPEAAKGLTAGMTLRLPEPGDSAEQPSETSAGPSDTGAGSPMVVDHGLATAANADRTPESRGYYTARNGDTYSSISRKTGVNSRTLQTLNPTIGDTDLREGTLVRTSANATIDNPEAYRLTLIDSIIYQVQPVMTVADNKTQGEVNIAIMLPFATDLEVVPRSALLATDFYKGFLMALEGNHENIEVPFKVIPVDTHGTDEQLRERLEQLGDQGINLVIPPDDDAKSRIAREFASDNGAVILNVLSIKDESYQTDANTIQLNINPTLMFSKAIGYLLNNYRGYKPVILTQANGRNEKATFVEQLKGVYADQGVEVIEIGYRNELTATDLSKLSQTDRYVFIPNSGSQDVFDSFAQALIDLKMSDDDYDRIKVFGYPDWIAIRGESADKLHGLNVTIYSRFFTDDDSYAVEDIKRDYVNWYGSAPEDVFPNQGYLGYDTGSYIIRAAGRQGNSLDSYSRTSYDGVQSAFGLTQLPDAAGLINNTLYIIEFLPGQSYIGKVI